MVFFEALKPKDAEVFRQPYYPGAILQPARAQDPLTALWADDGNDEASQTEQILLSEHLSKVAVLAKNWHHR